MGEREVRRWVRERGWKFPPWITFLERGSTRGLSVAVSVLDKGDFGRDGGGGAYWSLSQS